MVESDMALEEYRRKRDFGKTAEPKGRAPRARQRHLGFVVQKHAASRLHYDFRLELDGVLKSWAVPKGPSVDPADKRLAVQVEDHPIEYGGFEGTIPEDEYGGGTVMLWDRGTWEPLGDPHAGLAKGSLKFRLDGSRLKGNWALVQMHGERSGGGKNWLLIKEHDGSEQRGHGDALVTRYGRSVVSRRTMEGIAKAGDRVWRSKPRRTALETKAMRLVERAAAATAERPELPGARTARMPLVPRPELCSIAEAPPKGADWLHEIKLDGYRMLARFSRGKVEMLSRNGKSWSRRFPRIETALAELPVESAILDGEVVHLDAKGVSSFSALKDDLSANRTDGLLYYLFDLLYLDGKSLEAVPLASRKAALEQILAGAPPAVLRFSGHVEGRGERVFAEACKMQLEGIISKRADAPYRAGRTGDWVKVKCHAREEFIVLGWTDPGGKRKGFGALLLGYYDGTRTLRFAGAVGTGFNSRSLDELSRRLDRLARKTPPSPEIAEEAPKGTHWVKPELVAEIEYTEWTEDGRLRHPSFQGLREDKEAEEVMLDRTKAAAAPPPAAVSGAKGAVEIAGVRLTHPQKVLYPDAGLTKLDLARYYVAVAEHMLPHVEGRPLTLVRCPEGAAHKCFYQKHPGEGTPDALKRIEIPEKSSTATYLIADDVAGLVSLVQMGVLEVHLWGSTRLALEKPDRIIFDLDPDVGLPWERVVTGAFAVRDLLAEMGLESWPKTTGGKGLHVVLPVSPKYDWEAVKAFAREVANEIVRREPSCYTGALPKKARHGKIFIDYLRNQRGATAIAPFSARARAGAPVAMPVTWKEVEAGIRGDAFTIVTAPERLRKQRRDPWSGLLDVRQQIPASVMKKVA